MTIKLINQIAQLTSVPAAKCRGSPAPAGNDGRKAKGLLLGIVFLVFGWLLYPLSLLRAQGFIPPPTPSTMTAPGTQEPVLIDQKVPESLTVIAADGTHRTLLSYKSALEVLFIVFLSEPCEATGALWQKFRRLSNVYEGWRVSFLAVSALSEQGSSTLANTLQTQGLSWPLVYAKRQAAASTLGISATPEILIVDEFGNLRYRGPWSGAGTALETVIGHLESVKDPEPAMAGGCAL